MLFGGVNLFDLSRYPVSRPKGSESYYYLPIAPMRSLWAVEAVRIVLCTCRCFGLSEIGKDIRV